MKQLRSTDAWSLDPFLTMRAAKNRAARGRMPEPSDLRIHESVYSRVRVGGARVHRSLAARWGMANHNPYEAIAKLRRLVYQDDPPVQERKLQLALLGAGFGATSKVVSEVGFHPQGKRAMRMDLVVGSTSIMPGEIVELKRGDHLLVVKLGTEAERLSASFQRTLKQALGYAQHLNDEHKKKIAERRALSLSGPLDLRIVAGRRLPTACDYTLLTAEETKARDAGLRLTICTWDALLAELEFLHRC